MDEFKTFQIVIPTIKGRERYLCDAIMSVLKQNDPKVSIIISNNGADPAIRRCIESFDESKIFYYETPKQLAMAEHWEFAISHVTADFFTIIGDDDALTPFCMKYVRLALKKYPCALSIVHKPAQYFWPDYLNDWYRNLYILHGRNSGEITLHETKSIFKEVIEFRAHYGSLPFLYHGFVATSLIRKIQKNEGRIFARISPDIYSDLVLACYLKDFVRVDAPLTIGGQGAKSNGANVLMGTDSGKQFYENLPDFLQPIRPGVSIYLQLFEYIEKIREKFFQGSEWKVKWISFFLHSMLEAIKSASYQKIILDGVRDVLIDYCPFYKRVFFILAIKIVQLKFVTRFLRWLLRLKEMHDLKRWRNAEIDFNAKSVFEFAWAINFENINE